MDSTDNFVFDRTSHFSHSLLGDSTLVAAQEKCKKVTTKDGKAQQYCALAKDIFEGDKAMGEEYLHAPVCFATSVETHLQR